MRQKLISSSILSCLLLAGVYFLLGIGGLQLAIPPDYATAVFPAAGMGLVAVLYGGCRLLPGVWLGSAGINLWVAWTHDGLDEKGLLIAAAIALGSTLQAWVAAVLVRYRLKDAWRILDHDQDIIRFLMLAGPLACLVSASWGSSVLVLFQVISGTGFAFNWWNWWVGDTLGVLLFAPLILMVLQHHNPLWKTRLTQVAIPTLAATVGMMVAFVYVSNSELYKFKQGIAEQGLSFANQLQIKLLSYEDIVASLNSFVRVSPNLDFSDFDRFTRQHFAAHPDLQALSWNPLIAQQDRKPFEAVMAKEFDVPGFQISRRNQQGRLVAADSRDHYVVVRYISPLAKNRKALGYDISSDGVRESAINAAARSGKSTVTAPVRLVQESSSSAGVLLVNPVYLDQPQAGPFITESRKPYGFTVGVFRVEEMLARYLAKNLPDTLAFVLEDRAAPEGGRLLYHSGQTIQPQLIRFAWASDIPIGGRLWRLSVYPTPAYFAAARSLPAWIVLAAGLVLVSLLQVLLLAMTGRTAVISRQVKEQTAELSGNEKFLRLSQEGGGIGTWEADLVNNRQTWSDKCIALLGLAKLNEPTWQDFLAVVHPEDRQRLIDATQAHVDNGTPYDVEYRAIHGNGNIRWMRSAGQAEFDADGKPVVMRGIVQDLTERHSNQQRIEQLLDEQKAILQNRLVGIVTVRDRKIMWANLAFETMLGYDEGGVIGMPTQQFYVHEEDYQTVGEAYANIKNEGLMRTRLKFMRKDGLHIWVDMSGTILHKESGESLWVAIDVTERKRIETILRQKEGYQRALLDNFPFMVWLKDTESRFLAVNQALADAIGEGDPNAMLGKTEFDYLPREIAEDRQRDDRSVLAASERKTLEEEQVDPLGMRRWLETFKAPVVDDNGAMLGTVGFSRDISSRKKIELDLRIAATVFESQEGMLVSDANNVILRVNHAFRHITGYSADEVIGKNPSILNSGRHDADFYSAMWASINNTGAWKGEIWNRRRNDEIYPGHLVITAVKDQNDIVTNYVATLTDITLSKAATDEIERLAFYDPLTQLPNRRLLQERLKHGINVERRDGKHLGLLMLDLDRFKAVNDSLGHQAGDELLQQVALRITARLRDVDMVARLGGDEFIVLLEDITQPEDAARVAEEIITDLTKPFCLAQSDNVQIGASIGISLYPQHGGSPELLLDHADAALYQAKEAGRGCFAYFSEDLTLAARERMVVETRLRRAIVQQELRVFYQPQVDIASGRIVGAEALVRWQDPVEGLIPPLCFIPIAEETGLIVEIGEWVLRETCRQGRRWLDAGLPPLSIAVNVSSQQFRRSDICALVATVLRETGFPAQQLELEITESGLMGNQDNATAILNNLRAQGVRLAIDDFGTGYSSLAYLKHFPLDVLKIDKSFIDDIPFHQDDMEIAATIVAMGHILGFKVLAEGVETAAQLAFLQEKGCDMYQGYIHSKPVPAHEFALLLRDQQHAKGSALEKDASCLS